MMVLPVMTGSTATAMIPVVVVSVLITQEIPVHIVQLTIVPVMRTPISVMDVKRSKPMMIVTLFAIQVILLHIALDQTTVLSHLIPSRKILIPQVVTA